MISSLKKAILILTASLFLVGVLAFLLIERTSPSVKKNDTLSKIDTVLPFILQDQWLNANSSTYVEQFSKTVAPLVATREDSDGQDYASEGTSTWIHSAALSFAFVHEDTFLLKSLRIEFVCPEASCFRIVQDRISETLNQNGDNIQSEKEHVWNFSPYWILSLEKKGQTLTLGLSNFARSLDH